MFKTISDYQISCGVGSWQAFPDLSNIFEQGQELTQLESSLKMLHSGKLTYNYYIRLKTNALAYLASSFISDGEKSIPKLTH
jgi:hypothetical protein